MVRTQIQLTERQSRRIKAVARQRKVSVAAVIRECVDATLSEKAATRRRLYNQAMRIVGAFTDRKGARDISRRHDAYLAEAYK